MVESGSVESAGSVLASDFAELRQVVEPGQSADLEFVDLEPVGLADLEPVDLELVGLADLEPVDLELVGPADLEPVDLVLEASGLPADFVLHQPLPFVPDSRPTNEVDQDSVEVGAMNSGMPG